ncbi:hypothetical protein ACPA1U_22045, partial [Ectopseudomonas hydrolytica]
MHSSLEQMTVWGLVSEASLLVQAVMLSLVLASLVSWYWHCRKRRRDWTWSIRCRFLLTPAWSRSTVPCM